MQALTDEQLNDVANRVGVGLNQSAEARGPMNIGDAMDHIKAGGRIARAGWNGKGMWLAYSPGSPSLPSEKFWAGPNREYASSQGGSAPVLPCVTMKTATGEVLMGWLASQSDLLANDWVRV